MKVPNKAGVAIYFVQWELIGARVTRKAVKILFFSPFCCIFLS